MTRTEDKAKVVAIKELLERDEDFERSAVQFFVQAALEAQMTEVLSAKKGERTDGWLRYRSGYHQRALITRVGTRASCHCIFTRLPSESDDGGKLTTMSPAFSPSTTEARRPERSPS